MAIKVKIAGAYQDVAGVFVKRSGVYEAIAGVFAKVDGSYASILGGAPYVGVLATRSFFPDGFDATRQEYMAETKHTVRAASDVIGIVVVNAYRAAYANGGAETASGAVMNVTASVAKSATGPFTRITWSSSNAGACASGAKLASDLIPYPVSPGDELYIRIWRQCSSGIVIQSDTIYGTSDKVNRGTTTTDQTMINSAFTSGSVTTSRCFPAAVIGTITAPSVAIMGDSRAYGVGDTIDAAYEIGEVCRSVGPAFGYINLSRRTVSPSQWASSHSLANQLAGYCSHIICQLGVNAFVNQNQTYAVAKAAMDSVWAGMPAGMPIYQTTVSPVSTGAWAATDFSDQTATWNDRLPLLNDYFRTAPSPLSGVFETADAVESARNSGKWKAPSYTGDGTHGSQTANLAIKNSGAINTALIHR